MRLAGRSLIVLAALILAGAMVPYHALIIAPRNVYTDFDVYYRAAERLALGKLDQIYTLADGASPFRYAPPSLILFRPFAELPLVNARRIWFLFQYLCFIAGFAFLFRSLKLTRRGSSFMLALSFLIVARYVWDCFVIGQVASAMFLGFCAALYAWMMRRRGAAGVGLYVPTFFKIGPGFLFFLLGPRSWKAAAALSIVLAVGTGLWIGGGWEASSMLWQGWISMVRNDSNYFDSSHYANQSLNGVLLRLLPAAWAGPAHLLLSALICLAVLGFWLLRSARRLEGRAYFYCLGLFVYLLCMPQTFKFSMTTLAIPAAFLLGAPRKSSWDTAALAATILFISLPAKDVIPDWLFFGIQKSSLPFVSICLMFAAIGRRAWLSSIPSKRARMLRATFFPGPMGPWERLPARAAKEITLLVPVPMDSVTKLDFQLVRKTLQGWAEALARHSSEILFVPYGNRITLEHPVATLLRKEPLPVASRWIAGHRLSRGAALRDAFLESEGQRLFTLPLDQPCEPRFFEEALALLDSGAALVRANRRHPESRFKIPVRLLRLVYGRHRLGLAFNRLVRLALSPVKSTDTHSGTFGMTRPLALHAFAVQSSPDFLFDLELSLSAYGIGAREADLPVSLLLAEEKSFSRMLQETLAILHGLPLLAWRLRQGCYAPSPRSVAITADDWGLSPGVNRGILSLAQAGVIRRVSLMAGCSFLRDGLAELKAVPGIELGLHFNLTYGRNPASPGRFLLSWLRDRSAWTARVREELEAQLAQLAAVGVKPSYIDGHHHVHVVPGLIDAVADILKAHGIRGVRVPYDRALWLTGKAPLLLLALRARRSVVRQGFETLPFVYPQAVHFQDHGRMRATLSRNPRAEIIVHPADTDDVGELETPDTYSAGRVTEFQSLRMLSHGI